MPKVNKRLAFVFLLSLPACGAWVQHNWSTASAEPGPDTPAYDLEFRALDNHEGKHTLHRYIDHELGNVCYTIPVWGEVDCLPLKEKTP